MKKSPYHYTLSDDDRKQFRQAMQHIKTNKKSKRIVPEFELKDHWPETVSAEELLSYCKSNVPKSHFRQLQQGKYPFDAVLDLHGLTIAQSRKLLQKFLEDCFVKHYQCVNIIHGKSQYTDPNAPALKNGVNGWLQQCPFVIAFCSALKKKGGAGAVTVLLQTD